MTLIDRPTNDFVKFCVANLEKEFLDNKNMSLTKILIILSIKYDSSLDNLKINDCNQKISEEMKESIPDFRDAFPIHKVLNVKPTTHKKVVKKTKKALVNTPSFGFIPFKLDMKPKVDREFPDMSQQDKSYTINYRWQTLSDSDRAVWQKIASEKDIKPIDSSLKISIKSDDEKEEIKPLYFRRVLPYSEYCSRYL